MMDQRARCCSAVISVVSSSSSDGLLGAAVGSQLVNVPGILHYPKCIAEVFAAQIIANLLTANKHIKWKLLKNSILKEVCGETSFFIRVLPTVVIGSMPHPCSSAALPVMLQSSSNAYGLAGILLALVVVPALGALSAEV